MLKIERISESLTIPSSASVTVKKCGNITEIVYSSHRNETAHIKRVGKDYYIILKDDTGELLEINHGNSRIDDLQSVKRSLEKLRDYINTNVTDVSKCRWITFTYAENMTNPERLITDFRAFNRRCRAKYGDYEYITAAEPQQRGAWHLHAVFIFDKSAPFMENKAVREMWGQGFVNVQKLNDIDNIGLYLTAYLADIPLDEITEQPPNDGNKAIIKGARMKLYPRGFHIYRISKGIKKPVKIVMSNENAEKLVKGHTKIYENAVKIKDEGRNFNITTNKRVYNKNPNAKTFIKGSEEK